MSEGTEKYRDTEIKGLVIFVGKRSKTWYFQINVGGQTKRVLIGRFPVNSVQAARTTAMGLALEMGRGTGKVAQVGAPALVMVMEVYLARPKLRPDQYKHGVRACMENQLKDWLRPPLDEITKSMAVRRHQQLVAHPSTAKHALRYFRSIYNHARRTHDLPECPTLALKWYKEQPDGRSFDLPNLQTLYDIPAPLKPLSRTLVFLTQISDWVHNPATTHEMECAHSQTDLCNRRD